ncbi:hypothetical protein CFBP1590_0394 [Pseudomonas viridiflava]|uniref:Swt1-like HEPN domain-containing protein n=1 Tax=Pseudomonas viridiflava TaxID=33069 RepID=A0A1Y6JDQ4_PSEVI|nr:hypothetical protein [Pseudomonas viridiflava]SMS07979.1 hypothetical protein CFBP1590_0394 [Pseudomonas viridiflava]
MRRLIDDAIKEHYDGMLSRLPMKKDSLTKATARRALEPLRYPRDVDALLFDDLIAIICHPQQYPHFRDALSGAFENGENEARTYLNRIVDARNPLSHANEITSHQALRVACYSTDVIDSLKAYYKRINMAEAYNAPSIIRIWDDQANAGDATQLPTNGAVRYFDFKRTQLRPGDVLQLEVQPDESFPEDSYDILWVVNNVSTPQRGTGRIFTVTLENQHVSASGFMVSVEMTSNKNWHRYGNVDDRIMLQYSILPPV